eukprot:1801682-Prymnesium_polylepis.1
MEIHRPGRGIRARVWLYVSARAETADTGGSGPHARTQGGIRARQVDRLPHVHDEGADGEPARSRAAAECQYHVRLQSGARAAAGRIR